MKALLGCHNKLISVSNRLLTRAAQFWRIRSLVWIAIAACTLSAQSLHPDKLLQPPTDTWPT